MSHQHSVAGEAAWFADERARLVRLCTLLTRDPMSAEDLAQETLIEAWRHADTLRHSGARQAWLSGIARNLCRRWLRSQGRDHQRSAGSIVDDSTPVDWPDKHNDLALELEREELAILLDRALALLPEATRFALIQHYVHDMPQFLVAERLGLSQSAVAMRLARGKLTLRRILATDLRADAESFGLGVTRGDPWAPTRVWCPMCGADRLAGQFNALDGTLVLRCPTCFPRYGLHQVQSVGESHRYRRVQSVAAAYRLLLTASHAYFEHAFRDHVARCPACGLIARLHRTLPASELPRLREARGVHMHCTVCDGRFHVSLGGLVLSHPAAREFWWHHRRIRAEPEREIVVDGRAVLVSRLESVTSRDALDVITDAHDLTVLRVYANGRDLLLP